MSRYALVDVDQLEADLEGVADVLREVSGATEKLDWPEDYKSVSREISKGVEVKRETASVSIVSGSCSVSFSFVPDVVYLTANESYDGYLETAAAAFAEAGTNNINTMIWGGSYPADMNIARNDTQCNFEVISITIANGHITEEPFNGTFTCTAVKYT